MKVKDVMTPDPVCCAPETTLVEVAQIMVGYDCGEVPVIENQQNKNLVGVITDRDIVCRSIAANINPLSMKTSECMSQPAVSIGENQSIEDCSRLMREKQIRRVPVVNDDGAVCGIVALADITKYSSAQNAGAILREVSTEIGAASNTF